MVDPVHRLWITWHKTSVAGERRVVMVFHRRLGGVMVVLMAGGLLLLPVTVSASDHLGQWQMNMQGQVLELVFLANGQGSLGGEPFTYQIQGNQILIAEADGTVSMFGISVAGNTLALTSVDGTLNFQRVGGAPAQSGGGPLGGAAAPPGGGPLGGALAGGGAPSAVGTWQGSVGGSPVTMELKADGSMVFAGHPGTYTLKPGQLVINLGGQAGTYGLRLHENSLFLTGADLGGTVEFTRTGGTLAQPSAAPAGGDKVLQFGLYKFQQDQSILAGYPQGWTPSEFSDQSMLAVMFQERATPDSAGIITVVVPVLTMAGIETSQQLTELLLQVLRQQSLPDLQVLSQKPHPQAPDVTLTDISASDAGTAFRGHLCCALAPVGPQVSIGVFSLLFAPVQRYGEFSTEQVLTGNLAPVFGSMAKLAAANQQGAGGEGGWTPPSYDGYAYGMGGYDQDMLSKTDQAATSMAEQQMTMEAMSSYHQTVMDGMATMTEPTYDAGWYGDTYMDGSGFTYDYGSSYY
jgi:hypothetical protein